MSEAQPETPETPEAASVEVETPGTALTTPESVPAVETTWRDGIDIDLRQDPTLSRFKNTTELAKSYLEARRKISDPGMHIPGPDSTPVQVREAMTALGCPESADAYNLGDFKPPEGLPWEEAFQNDALSAMHNVGLNDAQARPLLEWYGDRAKQVTEAQAQAEADQHAAWDNELAEKWGTASEKRYALAVSAMERGLGDAAGEIGSARLPNGGLLRHHPGFRDMLANMGDLLAEHGMLGESEPARFSATPEQALQRIKDFEADVDKTTALFDKTNPAHARAAEEWQRLHQQAYPGSQRTGASTAVEIAG